MTMTGLCVTPLPKFCGCISEALRSSMVLTLISSVGSAAKDKIRQIGLRSIMPTHPSIVDNREYSIIKPFPSE